MTTFGQATVIIKIVVKHKRFIKNDSVNVNVVFAPFDPVVEQKCQRGRIEPVLQGQQALGQRISRVAAVHLEDDLADDWPGIQLGGHDVHACTVLFLAGFKNAPVCVHPPVARRQGWVNVDDLAGKAVDKTGAEHPHKAGQNDMVGLETGTAAARLRSKARRSGNFSRSTQTVSMPVCAAISSPRASGRSEMTARICASRRFWLMAP